jgi:hypothetical protein
MAESTTRKIHFFRDNSGKAFKNGAPGNVANTLCEANYKAEGLLTTVSAPEVTCSSCLKRLAAGALRQPPAQNPVAEQSLSTRQSRGFARFRNSLLDPIVVAAFLGLIGAGIGAAFTNNRTQNLEATRAKCERAFAFLQDEAVNSRLESDNAFYQMQHGIAVHCSRSAE